MATAAPKQPRRTKTIEAILNGRSERRAGLAYKLAANSLAVDVVQDNVATVKLDGGAMKATAIITTPTVDRVGDLLIPAGGRFANYKKNPVVLWNHGLDYSIPIGRSEDDGGNLAVRVNDDFVEADSYFSKSLKEAEQIFRLIEEKVVRAVSVRETPIITSYKNLPGFGDVLIVDEWELEEWSWVPVGMNPDAVRKAIDSNRIAGMTIAEPILKSLLPLAPELKRFGVGWTPANSATTDKTANESPKGIEMKLSANTLKSMPLSVLKSLKADNPDDAAVDDELKRREDEPVDTKTGNGTETEGDMQIPPGAQLLAAVHSSLAGLIANCEEGLKTMEKPEVIEGLTASLGALRDQTMALEGIYSSVYADAPALTGDGQTDDDAEESLKSFLAAGSIPQFQVQGIGARLKSLAACKNITPEQRGIIRGVCEGMSRIVRDAKAKAANSTTDASKSDTKSATGGDSPDPAKLAELQKQIDAMKAQMSA